MFRPHQNRFRIVAEIQKYGIFSPFPCDRCFLSGLTCIVMESSNRLKCSECVRAGRVCVNLFWETLDKTREEYRKKMRENKQELARVIGRLLRNKSILQQIDERAKTKIRCFMEKLEKSGDLERVVDCFAISFLIKWSPAVWFFLDVVNFCIDVSGGNLQGGPGNS